MLFKAKSHFPSSFLNQYIHLQTAHPNINSFELLDVSFNNQDALQKHNSAWAYIMHFESKYSAFFFKLSKYSTFLNITYNQKV